MYICACVCAGVHTHTIHSKSLSMLIAGFLLQVFIYSGEACEGVGFVMTFAVGLLLIIALGIVIPVLLLIYIYKPQVRTLNVK